MAKVFIPWAQDGVELCQPINPTAYDSVRFLINGLPRGETWVPLQMNLIHEDQGRPLRYSSSPWFGQESLIFRPECFNVIGEDLKKRGEVAPSRLSRCGIIFFQSHECVGCPGRKSIENQKI